jgi:hypothetical protein
MDTTELIKFIAALPAPAAVAFTIVLALIVGVSWRGILQGRSTDPAQAVPAAQVAAVIVDPTALNNATAALNRHSNATEQQTGAIAGLTKSIDHMAIEFDRVREELRIQREISRRN